MNKFLPLAVLVLLVIVGILFVFLKNNDDVFVVRAQDGVAELRIPKDAVLEGGTIKDITMTAIAPADFFKESNQPIDSAKIYRLEPDGLTFSKPATISVTLPYDKNKAYSPIFLTYSGEGGGAEILDVADFRPDEERGTYTVSGALSHFSDLIIADLQIFKARHIPESDITLPIGQSFDHIFVIAPQKWEFVENANVFLKTKNRERRVTLELVNGTRWGIDPSFQGLVGEQMIYTRGLIEPKKVAPLEAADLGATEEHRIMNRFTCVKAGYDRPSIIVYPYYIAQVTETFFNEGKQEREPWVWTSKERRHGYVVVQGTGIDCVAPPSGEAPSRLDATKDAETSATIAPTSPAPKPSGGIIKVCGLPGGPACPKK